MLFAQNERNFIIGYAPGHNYQQITDAVNALYHKEYTRNQIKDFLNRNKIVTGSRVSFPEEVKIFVQEYAQGHTYAQIADEINLLYKKSYTPVQIKYFLQNNRMSTGRGKLFTEEEKRLIQEYACDHSFVEITDVVNDTFDKNYTQTQIKNYLNNHHIHTQRNATFHHGHSINSRPIGTEVIKRKGDKQFYFVKVDKPNTWKYKHHYIWERHNGPIPEDSLVIFLDGNSLNPALENLILVKKADFLYMCKHNLPHNTKEQTLCSIQLAKLRRIIAEASRRVSDTK